MTVNLKSEKTATAWMWRVLLGPCMIVDGVVSAITLGTVNADLCLRAARNLARARIKTTMTG